MAGCRCCSPTALLLLFLATAVPAAYLLHLETAAPPAHSYTYYSSGWMRECSKWDHRNASRFIVSFFEGGLGVVPVVPQFAGRRMEEVAVVRDSDYAGNSSLGFVIDGDRRRVVVAVADVFGNKYSAVAAYDLDTWDRLFLTRLAGPGDEKSMADDVAVDEEGNAYITDTKGSKLWKVGPTGEYLGTIEHPLFKPAGFLNKQVGLNGILYHPNRYLLVIHTMSGNLYKVSGIDSGEVNVQLVNVTGSLKFGDGLQFLTPNKVVVAGNPTRKIESTDDWATAKVLGVASGKTHRVVTAATVKDDKVYLNHFMGLGYPIKKHILIEPVFKDI